MANPDESSVCFSSRSEGERLTWVDDGLEFSDRSNGKGAGGHWDPEYGETIGCRRFKERQQFIVNNEVGGEKVRCY